jgi:hypothetical protein
MKKQLILALVIALGVQACATLKDAAKASGKAAADEASQQAETSIEGKSYDLAEKEVWLLNAIFGKTLDTSRVKLVLASAVAYGSPKTVKNKIHFPKEKADISDEKYRNSRVFLALITHECTHVWQFQNQGLGYIPDSLFNQGMGVLEHGSRNKAYHYNLDPKGEKPFQKYNSEQQARLLQDYVNAKVFGVSPKKCDNWDVVKPTFSKVIEGMIKRDINPDFTPLESKATREKLKAGGTVRESSGATEP